MKLFRANRKKLTYSGTIVRMAVIAGAAAIVWWAWAVPYHGVRWFASLFGIAMLLALYLEFVCFCELIFTSDNREREAFRTGTERLKWPAVDCEMPLLLKLFRDTWPDGGVDLYVRHKGVAYRIGVVSDYDKEQGFFDQAYIIDDNQFETEQEFLSFPLKEGVTLADIESLTVLSADGVDPKPLIDSLR
jgi:hypothetical protein